MSFVHAIKVFFGNFSLCYKTLVYKLIAIILSVAIVATFMYNPLIEFYNMGGLDGLTNMFKAANISSFFALSHTFFNNFASTFNVLTESSKAAIIAGIIVFMFLVGFLYNLDRIPKADIISNKLSSNMRLGYTGEFFKFLGYSALFSLVNMLYFVVSCAIIGSLYVVIVNAFYSASLVSPVAPFVIFVVLIILITLANTIFGTHAATCVLNESGVFSGLIKSVKNNFKNFLRVFSLNLGYVVLAVLVNVFAGLISAGALLILTVPITIVFYDVLSCTICYNEHGNRYYIDPQTIITPRQNESYDKVKNIIDLI